MPTILNVPFIPEEFKEDEEDIINTAVNKNQESTKPLAFHLVFHGIPISNETEVVAQVANPILSLVRDLRKEIATFAKSATNNQELSAAAIKLNFVGVTLQDEKERISHVVKRMLKDRHLSNPALLKIFVSLDQNSRLVQQQQQNDFPLSSSSSSLNTTSSALRRDRESNNGEMGAGGNNNNMSVEQADAMANMMASNPQMIEMILNSDPTMREMMRTNPDFARQMRDPDTLRNIFRSQASRQGRVMQDNEQRAALAFIQNHPDGSALIERALGREGILTENGEGSMFAVSGNGNNAEIDAESSNANNNNTLNGSLLPPTTATRQGPLLPLPQGMSMNNNNNISNSAMPFLFPQQPQPQSSNENKIKDLVKKLTEEMGFDMEIAELAANEANGDLEKALSLLEEWQN